MALILTDEQNQLRDSARDFMAEQAPIAQLRRLRDSADADGFSRTLWTQFADMGFTGVLIPEIYGGMGLGPVEAGVVMEQIGHNLSASPLLASAIVAATALLRAGSTAQQTQWLPAMLRGQCIATLAIDEGSKHRPLDTACQAQRSGERWLLDGHKTFVLDGHVADLLLVVARSSGAAGQADGLSLFAVPRDTPGLAVERTTMVDAHNSARLMLRNVSVGDETLLGAEGAAWPAIAAALDAGRLAAAAELQGLADEAFERTVQFLKERRQFGKAIGEFQALQHRAAHLYGELEISRAAILHAQQRMAAGDAKTPQAVAVAKARAGRSSALAVQEGVQMHGGMGMTDASDMGLFMKRARVLDELFGDSHFQLDQMALMRGY